MNTPLVPAETLGCGCFYDSLGKLALPCARHKPEGTPEDAARTAERLRAELHARAVEGCEGNRDGICVELSPDSPVAWCAPCLHGQAAVALTAADAHAASLASRVTELEKEIELSKAREDATFAEKLEQMARAEAAEARVAELERNRG
jgi:hypothetical protein